MSRALAALAAGMSLFAGFVLWQSATAGAPARTGARALPSAPAATLTPADSAAVRAWYGRRAGALAPRTRPPAWLAAVHVDRLLADQARALAAAGSEPERDSTLVGRVVRDAAGPHYLGAALAEQDSSLRRWRAGERLLGVWVDAPPASADSLAGLAAQVHALFASWNGTAAGVAFAAVRDSSRADVHVTWADSLGGGDGAGGSLARVGHTELLTDARGWIVAAHVVLAVRRDRATIQDAALHEAGHVLGLGHSPDRDDLMTAVTTGRHYRTTAADRNTARLLYQLRPGRVAAPAND
ncbi:MAG TPA: matrixin family metalloprotease [Gemmatirosa sp.]|nr:matrixin family metalloprotease [Gemmatirosa sp.]